MGISTFWRSMFFGARAGAPGHTVTLRLLCGSLCAALLFLAPQAAAGTAPRRAAHATPSASVDSVKSRAGFDRLARVYYTGRGTPMPHCMFAIDRAAHDRV